MRSSLIPEQVLKKTNKILFMTHLALGDFTYLQNCFEAFSRAFPEIEIHIWVDELRRTHHVSAWPFLRKYALYDWLAECAFVSKVYQQTYSPALYKQSILEAQQQAYPLVVSLATLRPPLYAKLARTISPLGFVVGMKKRVPFFALHQYRQYRQLDASLDPDGNHCGQHISEIYAGWFGKLFGPASIPVSRVPYVDIPPIWRQAAHDQLAQWAVKQHASAVNTTGRKLFINAYAKNKKRCWPLTRVLELIISLHQCGEWRNTQFIVNVMPEEREHATKFFSQYPFRQIHLFSAEENFFQLPAMLKECDLIVSVETAVMHLANAVQVPVVALMRQKNPEWAPINMTQSTVITTMRRQDWVQAIRVDQVIAAIELRIKAS